MRYALLVTVIGIGGVLVWAVLGRQARLLRRADKAARYASETSRSEGVPILRHQVWGAVDISPSSLAVVFFVKDDAALASVEASGASSRLRERTLELLDKFGYPALPHAISIVSDEAVARAGGWQAYFQ